MKTHPLDSTIAIGSYWIHKGNQGNPRKRKGSRPTRDVLRVVESRREDGRWRMRGVISGVISAVSTETLLSSSYREASPTEVALEQA